MVLPTVEPSITAGPCGSGLLGSFCSVASAISTYLRIREPLPNPNSNSTLADVASPVRTLIEAKLAFNCVTVPRVL